MPPQTVEVRLRDDFHRMKRALLLFATGALVLSLVHANGDADLSAGWGAVKIDRVTAWWLLFGGTFYYAIGFVSEALSAWRDHTDFTVRHSFEGVDAAIGALATKYEEARRDSQDATVALNNVTKVSDNVVHQIRERLAWAIGSLDPEAKRREVSGLPETVHGIIGQLDDRLRDQEIMASNVASAVDKFDARAKILIDELNGLRKQLARLSPRISWERRQHLRLWEIWSPFVLFGAVVILGMPEIVAGAARISFTPQLVQEWAQDLGCATSGRSAECEREPNPTTEIAMRIDSNRHSPPD